MSASHRLYTAPIVCDRALPGAWPLAGTPHGFREVAMRRRGQPAEILPAEAAASLDPQAAAAIARMAEARRPVVGLDLGRLRLMGVVNVTPDSFSDGGQHATTAAAHAHARALAAAGADILDIGGESTRPGATPVPARDEIAR
ncbi:MAG: dihydropteroate synthase, partial [Pseudomonadota bacterium]